MILTSSEWQIVYRNCPDGFSCLQGFGDNPNHGYTTFDTFGFSLLSVFRLITRDFVGDLYMKVTYNLRLD